MHPRARIRQAIVSALSTVPDLSGRVTGSRLRKAQDKDLPAVLVYTLEESATQVSLGRARERHCVVAIEIRVRGQDGDDVIDALCVVIENTIAADPTLGGLVLDCQLERTQIGLNTEAQSPQGIALVTFGVRYRHAVPILV